MFGIDQNFYWDFIHCVAAEKMCFEFHEAISEIWSVKNIQTGYERKMCHSRRNWAGVQAFEN